jgi:hypothetical protein
MAQHNLLVVHEHLFARKGEAAPAGDTKSDFGHSCLSGIPHNGSKHNGSKQQNSQKRKRPKRDASPLSSLIQRRPCPPEVSSGRGDTVATEHSVFATWRQLRNRLETAHQSDPKAQWKKLTFRLHYDQYMRLKNLAGLWGSTYQGILEKAVAYYLDEATTSEDFKWKV